MLLVVHCPVVQPEQVRINLILWLQILVVWGLVELVRQDLCEHCLYVMICRGREFACVLWGSREALDPPALGLHLFRRKGFAANRRGIHSMYNFTLAIQASQSMMHECHMLWGHRHQLGQACSVTSKTQGRDARRSSGASTFEVCFHICCDKCQWLAACTAPLLTTCSIAPASPLPLSS